MKRLMIPAISCFVLCTATMPVLAMGGGGGGGGTTTTTTTTTSTSSTTVTTTTTTTTSTTTTTIPPVGGGGGANEYSIVAVGVVGAETRVITLEGVRKRTWADYALWSADNRNIYFKSGEKFYGKIHSNTKLWFDGDPEFFARVTSAETTYGGSTNSCTFHNDFVMGVASQTMVTVNFTNLFNKSTMVLTGKTDIVIQGTNIVINNDRAGYSSHTNPIAPDTVIYIEDATTGSSSTRPGEANISGQLDGRLTIVTESNVNVTNHLTYADDSKTNNLSDDALGLISRHDVIVKQSCPDDLKIYAHILATGLDTPSETDGSFAVEDYADGSPRGQLIVHGGIAQNYRGAVGTFSTQTGNMVSGYEKNYTYDVRFLDNPPPQYPPLSDKLSFGLWREE